jgi:hypothetical protein
MEIRELAWTRSSLEKLGRRLPAADAVLDGWLREVVAARDELAFRNLVCAALCSGRSLRAEHLVGGTPLFEHDRLFRRAAVRFSGDVGAALVAAVETRRLDIEREALALALAAVWCREREGGRWTPGLLIAARRLGRLRNRLPTVGLALAIVCSVTRDPALQTILEGVPVPWVAGFESEFWKEAESDLWDCVPQETPPVLSGYTVRRAVARVGRNEPCPCGSGRKYKQCCLPKDQERLRQSSAVPGLTLQEWREQPELALTWRRLRDMPSYEVVRLDPRKVPPELRDHLMDRLLGFNEIEAAVHCLEVTGFGDNPDWFYWEWTLHDVVRAGQRALAERLLALRPGIDLGQLGVGVRLLLAGDEDRRQLDVVEEEALRVLRSESSMEILLEFVHGLLAGRTPALGLLVARGVLPLAPAWEGDTLLSDMLEVRDRLALDVVEPMEEVFHDLLEKPDDHRWEDSEELARSRRALEIKGEEVRRLKADLAALQGDLHARERRAAKPSDAVPAPASESVPTVATDDTDMTELRSKLRGLRERLKERHTERNQLRRELLLARQQLAQAQGTRESQAPAKPTQPEEEPLFAEAEDLGQQPVRVPRWPHKFGVELARFPHPVARSVMVLVGRLAAGEPAAFVGVKRLRSTPDVYRQRVGAHYRLLFRLSSEGLEVVELVNRKDLERVIKARFS